MDLTYIIGELTLRFTPEELDQLESGETLKGKIFYQQREGMSEIEAEIFTIEGGKCEQSGYLGELEEDETYHLGIPQESVAAVREKGSVASNFISGYRKVRIMREDLF